MNKVQGITFIGAGTRLEGEMTLESAALVAGELRGKISSAGQIKIEPEGLIDGELDCHELRVCGSFRGTLRCQKLVIVHGGVVEGEVASNDMEIFDGGQFLGSRTRGPETVVLSNAPSALLPKEGGQGSLKLMLGLAAGLGLGWLVVAKTPVIASISDAMKAITSQTAQESAVQPVASGALMADTAKVLATPVQQEQVESAQQSAPGYFVEDADAMEAANNVLLENAFTENSAAGTVATATTDEMPSELTASGEDAVNGEASEDDTFVGQDAVAETGAGANPMQTKFR
ncbi:polymer-forming cytoskeletal protein [Shewanella sp.]|uniref:bactofilin family protein n=1 Tax=Shewanella sp. TaxID=50422 RepID=UPI0035623651